MGQQNYLIDTNTAIEYIGATLPEKSLNLLDTIIDDSFFLSVINKIELRGFYGLNREEEQKFNQLIESSTLISLEDAIIERTIALRKATRIKLPDAIIAATALEYDLTIITRNIKDFEQLPDIQLINSYSI